MLPSSIVFGCGPVVVSCVPQLRPKDERRATVHANSFAREPRIEVPRPFDHRHVPASPEHVQLNVGQVLDQRERQRPQRGDAVLGAKWSVLRVVLVGTDHCHVPVPWSWDGSRPTFSSRERAALSEAQATERHRRTGFALLLTRQRHSVRRASLR